MSTKIADVDGISFNRHDSLMSFTPAQCRSARAWLGLTQQELAQAAKVGISTVKDFESGARTPIQNNLGALQRALAGAGAATFLTATASLVPDGTADQDRTSKPVRRSERPARKNPPQRPSKRPHKGGRA